MHNSITTNPHYTARTSRAAAHLGQDQSVTYVKLPQAPITASPVPHLTSLYHNPEVGPWGDRRYPGNCSGNLIKDLLLYFKPKSVLDPMTGSGTCRDVCDDLGIACVSMDLREKADACSPSGLAQKQQFDFIWAHPPYWRQKLYTSDPRDLSRQPTLEAFLAGYGRFIANGVRALAPGGKFAVLMGDYSDREAGFIPLVYWTKHLAFEAGLRQVCTDIIRFSHGASSGRKVYRTSFIPGLHDVCMVFEKAPTATHRDCHKTVTSLLEAKIV
jgi:hypothetical protein